MINFENDVPKVAIAFMNEDHQHATEITNRLLSLAEQEQPDSEQVTTTLAELYDHAKEHFAHEEAEMRRINFPPYPMHQGEHQRVLAEMQQVLENWEQQQDLEPFRVYVQQTLPQWFIHHISTMDTITAQFLSLADNQ